jgi:hypothetical protein
MAASTAELPAIYQHPLAYLLGLQVRRRDELRQEGPMVGDDGTDIEDGAPSPEQVPGKPPDIWALHPICPDATNAAWLGKPRAIIWHFQLAAWEV